MFVTYVLVMTNTKNNEMDCNIEDAIAELEGFIAKEMRFEQKEYDSKIIYQNENTGTVVCEASWGDKYSDFVRFFATNGGRFFESSKMKQNPDESKIFKTDEIAENDERIVIPKNMDTIITNYNLNLDMEFMKDGSEPRPQIEKYNYRLGGIFIHRGIEVYHTFIITDTTKSLATLYTAPSREMHRHADVVDFYGVSGHVVGGGHLSVNKEHLLVFEGSSGTYLATPKKIVSGCAELLKQELEKAGMKINGIVNDIYDGSLNRFWKSGKYKSW
jgi:hypothetical protein